MQKGMFILVAILGMVQMVNSTTYQSNYSKAMEYLDHKSEVYFKFYVSKQSEIVNLVNSLSIDKVDVSEIYAYANRVEFENFLTKNLAFTTLPHPGDMAEIPEMSNYKNYDPKGTMSIDKYPTYEGYLELLNKFQQSYPKICKVFEIGKSVRGRSIMVVRISDKVTNQTREMEPSIFSNCTIHGDETTGLVCWMKMIELLCKEYGKDERVTNLVDTLDIWVCLMSNPDGTYRSGNNSVNGAIRANANGQDLNRTFPGPKVPNGKPQPETKILMKIDTTEKFVLGLDYHGGTEAVLLPWGYSKDNVHERSWWKYIADLYGDKSGYSSMVASSMYTANGSRIDWPYWGAHFRSVCIEASTQKLIPESQFAKYWNKNKDAILDFLNEVNHCLRGAVCDSLTGKGISGAKVYVENHDNDYSFVYSRELHGDYYRPIIKGTYDITFSHSAYHPRTIQGIQVVNGKATSCNVKLMPLVTGSHFPTKKNMSKDYSLRSLSTGFIISWRGKDFGEISVYSSKGQKMPVLLEKQDASTTRWSGSLVNNERVGNGLYLISLTSDHQTFTHRLMLSK